MSARTVINGTHRTRAEENLKSEKYKSDDGFQGELDPNVTRSDVFESYDYEGESDGRYEYFAEGEGGFEAYGDRNKKVRIDIDNIIVMQFFCNCTKT